MKRFIKIMILVLTLIFILYFIFQDFFNNRIKFIINNIRVVKVEEIHSTEDKNKNGIPDPMDLVITARKEVENRTKYVDGYYNGGYPKDGEGVCTDVIWRAFKGLDVNLKDFVDKDISSNIKSYPRVEKKPDPNIDFRRVPNLDVFFKRNAITLTNELIPGDKENLKDWQRGDIVIILKPYQHIVILSDKRTRDGVPYIIHNNPPNAVESASLEYMKDIIAGHYRWKY